ncbi:MULTISPECIES: ABC transporter substrate-binding protein [Paenibacillus]|uniref:ABC transporter substrate-binding protein n=1 Tax=Paenibacillus TaxID=44249 RepID=UPI002FE12210
MKNKFLMILGVMFIFLSACSPNREILQYEGDPKMKATLKIMTINSEANVMKDFGDMFNAKYPNIELKVINYNSNNYKKIIEDEKPDVFSLSPQEFEQYLADDRLYDLDALLNQDAFDLKGFHPEVINYLRHLGNGKLYGLSPHFQSKALYYNKDLFDKYGIPYPQDQMTWKDVFQLAERFPEEDGISGLYIRNFYTLSEEIARSEHVTKVNDKDMKVTLNTESYRKIFEMILKAYESRAISLPDIDLFEVYDPFIKGSSAMTFDYYYYINNNINWAKTEKGADFHLNWDLASAPVNEVSRDTSPYFNLFGIFSVSAESEQKQAAWELVKFVNSREVAKAKSRTTGIVPSSRTDYIYNPEGKRMDAFYNLKPVMNSQNINSDLFPKGFFGGLEGIINSEGKAAMVGAKTLDEAMASMQERGQRLLDRK